MNVRNGRTRGHAVPRTIRAEFPGKNNAALRAEIREAAKHGRPAVLGLARRIGLTTRGQCGLNNVAKLID